MSAMPLAHHPFTRRSARRDGTHDRQADRLGPLLRSAAITEPLFSVCVTLVALHLAALALLLPGRVSSLLRVAMLVCAVLGPPVLVLWFSHQERAGRVLAAGLAGLAATVPGGMDTLHKRDVVINADLSVQHRLVVSAMDQLRNAGFSQFSISTEPSAGRP